MGFMGLGCVPGIQTDSWEGAAQVETGLKRWREETGFQGACDSPVTKGGSGTRQRAMTHPPSDPSMEASQPRRRLPRKLFVTGDTPEVEVDEESAEDDSQDIPSPTVFRSATPPSSPYSPALLFPGEGKAGPSASPMDPFLDSASAPSLRPYSHINELRIAVGTFLRLLFTFFPQVITVFDIV